MAKSCPIKHEGQTDGPSAENSASNFPTRTGHKKESEEFMIDVKGRSTRDHETAKIRERNNKVFTKKPKS